MSANATRINTNKLLHPTFPTACVACLKTHQGPIDKAIDEGWHFTVFELKLGERVQFAGCPEHFEEWDGASLSFSKGQA